jgi:hypothetical protein
LLSQIVEPMLGEDAEPDNRSGLGHREIVNTPDNVTIYWGKKRCFCVGESLDTKLLQRFYLAVTTTSVIREK